MDPGKPAEELPDAHEKSHGAEQAPSGRNRRVYDQRRTAYLRLLDTGILDTGILEPATVRKLQNIHDSLNPAEITRRINEIQSNLITRVKLRAGTGTTRTGKWGRCRHREGPA